MSSGMSSFPRSSLVCDLESIEGSSPPGTGDVLLSQLVAEAAKKEHWEAMDAISQADIDERNTEIGRLRDALEAVHRSISWRLTAPLRRLSRRIPRLGIRLRQISRPVRLLWTPKVSPWLVEKRTAIGRLISRVRGNASGRLKTATPVPPDWSRAPDNDPALALPLPWAVPARFPNTRIAAIIHLYYDDLATEFHTYLQRIEEAVDVYISTCSDYQADLIRSAFQGYASGTVVVRVVPNRGRDIAPKLTAFNDVYACYEYVLHLHGKRSPHASVLAVWRQFMLENLVGDGQSARSIIAVMDAIPKIGMVGVQHFEPVRHWLGWGQNFELSQKLARRMSIDLDSSVPVDFPSGSMFWARSSALIPLLALGLNADDFEIEQGQTDGTLAHAIERLFFYSCEKAGFDWIKVGRPELYSSTPRLEKVSARDELVRWVDKARFSLLSPGGEKALRGVPEKMPGPSIAFVSTVRRRELGLNNSILEMPRKVAIGVVALDHPREGVVRAVASALASLNCLSPDAGTGTVWVLERESLENRVQPEGVVCITLGDVDCPDPNRFHDRLMAEAFSAGATHYISLDAACFLHPDAVGALMKMMAANRDRCLVDALRVPKRPVKSFDPYTFDTPWVDLRCTMIPRGAYQKIRLDEMLSGDSRSLDFSWRARAEGYLLKTCPVAFVAIADMARPLSLEECEMQRDSVARLYEKWGGSDATHGPMSTYVGTMKPRTLEVAQPVREEWRRLTDNYYLERLYQHTARKSLERLTMDSRSIQ